MSPVGIIIYLSMCISATYSASIVFLTVIRNQLHTVCCTVANMVVHHQCRFAIHTIMIALIQPVFVAYASCANHYNTSATASCTYHSRANMRIRTTCSLACENGIGDTADTEHYAQREEKEISLFHGDFSFCRFIRLSLLSTIVLYGMRQNKTLQFAHFLSECFFLSVV